MPINTILQMIADTTQPIFGVIDPTLIGRLLLVLLLCGLIGIEEIALNNENLLSDLNDPNPQIVTGTREK
jgi:hypothetical protein